ncbi:lipoprotein-releasing ABC transporter ATP-binding protein LolD [Alteromonas sp. a30]|uniref:lipoprotein-releasing ABC transporter ATP-binding protein LolD n=1 Tax=Alteromonas sp. a30 TaxID=2730917 RepID=UPI00227E13F6|nr:lipoprotein-releasing ABC transporter ATP-binding protein LolD [Alteromonas sp. a30]MCY7294193.1 lipoprotein-releasing ABC transporter ATP-binding protein LolD [Alteromonas sp. a30]
MSSVLLSCHNLTKVYEEGPKPITVLNNVSFDVEKGEQVAILGSSGSGKSTLLHLLGALDKPSNGEVLFEGEDIYTFTENQQANFRNQNLGFVYQQHHLLPEFTAMENTAMPLLIGGMKKVQAMKQAEVLLEKVGLAARAEHKPSALSGGERQRVAIARALVTNPKLVLADEPTGNLDDKTGEAIYELLLSLKEAFSTSFVVVTHDVRLAARLDRTLHLSNGSFVHE